MRAATELWERRPVQRRRRLPHALDVALLCTVTLCVLCTLCEAKGAIGGEPCDGQAWEGWAGEGSGEMALRHSRALSAGGVRSKARPDQVAVRPTKLPVTPRHKPPPRSPNMPHNELAWRYCGRLGFDSRYVEWVRTEVKPLLYDMEPLAFVQDWEPYLQDSREELDAAEVVIMSQSTPERLPQVRRMIHAWGGPISISLFVPWPKVDARATECRTKVLDYMRRTVSGYDAGVAVSLLYALEETAGNHCNVTEEMTGHERTYFNEALWNSRYKPNGNYIDIWDGEFPVNALRNLAKHQIQRDVMIYLVDSDMSPSRGSYANLRHGFMRETLLALRTAWQERGERNVVIVPTFERTDNATLSPEERASACLGTQPDCWLYNEYDIPQTRPKLLEMSAAGKIIPFYWTRWQRGHRCYLPLKWMSMTEPEVYQVPFQGGCEPYTIMLKDAMVDYDERYRGRYYDKVSQVQHMALLGAKFFVDPVNFLVHVPHASTVYSYTLISWFPANRDQECMTHTLLHIHADEVNKELNRVHHYSRIAATQLSGMHGQPEIKDEVVQTEPTAES